LPAWPPNSTEATWHPSDDGLLATTAPAGGQSTFRYDPHDPTPAVGGRRLAADAGVRNNAKLEARRDVLSFTTSELTTDLEFEGLPVVDVALSVDNPHADIFVRICDVDPRGRSHNISDAFDRLDPHPGAGEVRHLTVRLSPCAHRLLAGHRLRLQVSGGAHPQYARNLGTAEPLATGTSLKPACYTIHHADTRLTLPITSTTTTSTA
jgi:putative CocE/NonD family hydrolase